MTVTVDPEIMIPLISGHLEAVKALGIQLKGQIESLMKGERAVSISEAAIIPKHN